MRLTKLQANQKSAKGRRGRIAALRKRCEELGGQTFLLGDSPDCPPEVLEAFLESVLEFEEAARVSLFELLRREACLTPRPGTLGDKELPGKILEIAQALARHGFYLERTDHLDDRELYARLFNDVLHREYQQFSAPGGCWRLDLAGSGSEEDVREHLRYYADESERREWASQFPDFKLPKARELPFDRDRLLPKPPEDGLGLAID